MGGPNRPRVMPRGTFQIIDWSNYATWHFPIGPRLARQFLIGHDDGHDRRTHARIDGETERRTHPDMDIGILLR